MPIFWTAVCFFAFSHTLAFDFTKIWGLTQKYILAFDRNLTAYRHLFPQEVKFSDETHGIEPIAHKVQWLDFRCNAVKG